MQSKSEYKLMTANLHNNIIENSSKKHQKSHEQLALEIQRHLEISSAVKYNEQLLKDQKQNKFSRGENLNFEFQKMNRLQDLKSDNDANLSPSGQLSSEQQQKQKMKKLQYNEILKMNADIKKKNIQQLNDKLSKIGKVQADSNSVCYHNEKSNDTNNSINYQIINDEEEANQIQNNSYDSLHPNNNVNGSFETSSNKILPQSVSLNVYSKKFLKNQNKDLQKNNLPALIKNDDENQSYSSIEQPQKLFNFNDSQLRQEDQKTYQKQKMITDLFQDNSRVSLNYNDQSIQEIQMDSYSKIQRENQINDDRHGPGTANTHGGYMRQNYKQQQLLDYNFKDININFKDPSQQCQSEVINLNFEQNSSVINQNIQQISYLDQMLPYNMNSEFDRSFEILDPQNFHNSEFHYPNRMQKSNIYRQYQEFNLGYNGQQINSEIGVHQFHHENNIVNLLHYQNGMAIGEGVITDDMSSIPSINSIPVIRNQKSQATYRHGHQKISEVLNKYYHNNYGNSSIQQINNLGFSETSQSEAYRNYQKIQQSQASAPLMAAHLNQEIYSQLNDHQINTTQISQLSHESEMGTMIDIQNYQKHPGTKLEVFRNKKRHFEGKDGAFSGDDRHPFNGPKLHLFRKGQSKSSQAKLRKIKRSQNSLKQKYENELNSSIQNESSIKNQGTTNNNNLNNGHINISEILNGKIKLQPPTQYQEQNRLYTDIGSRNSIQSKISNDLEVDPQFSQEYHNYKEKNQLQQNIDFSNNGYGAMKGTSKQDQNKNKIIDKSERVEQSCDSGSQKCKSQFTTICLNPAAQDIDDNQEQRREDTILNGEHIILSKQKNTFESKRLSDYTSNIKEKKMNTNNSEMIGKLLQDANNEINNSDNIKQQSQEKKLENENELNTSQKANSSYKPAKNQNQSVQNFQHPKVGKNSKHPQVFRNKIMQQNSQKNKKRNYQLENENNQNLKTQMINLTFNNNFSKELQHSKSRQNLLNEQEINHQQMSPGFKLQMNDQNSSKNDLEQKIFNESKINQKSTDNDNNQFSQQVIIQKDQNSIFATTFEGFNQNKQQIQTSQNTQQNQNDQKKLSSNTIISETSNENQKLKEIKEKQIQKQAYNVSQYLDTKTNLQEHLVQDSQENVQIKIKFNENFDYQNSEIDRTQFKKGQQQNKSDMKSSINEQEIQYKRDQVHQIQKKNTFSAQIEEDGQQKLSLKNQKERVQKEKPENNKLGTNNNEKVRKNQVGSERKELGKKLREVSQNQGDEQYEEQKTSIKDGFGKSKEDIGENEGNRMETSSEVNGINLNNTQKSHSIAQTPCFAETPNTTDQFKGYKIDVTD